MGIFDEDVKRVAAEQLAQANADADARRRSDDAQRDFDRRLRLFVTFLDKELPSMLTDFVAAHVQLGHEPLPIPGAAGRGVYSAGSHSLGYSDNDGDTVFAAYGVDGSLQFWDRVTPPIVIRNRKPTSFWDSFRQAKGTGKRISTREWAAEDSPLTGLLPGTDDAAVLSALRAHYAARLSRCLAHTFPPRYVV